MGRGREEGRVVGLGEIVAGMRSLSMGSVDGGEAGSFSMASSLLDLHICGGTSTVLSSRSH